MKRTKPGHRGFTLLEVLVALGVVAIISILSWRGLNEVLRSTARVNAVDEASQTTMATFAQLESDLSSLNLGIAGKPEDEDFVDTNSTGLVIRTTQRSAGLASYREEIQWTLTERGLIRTVRREGEDTQAVVSDPIPVVGMQLRVLREAGAWSNPVVLGNYTPLAQNDLVLQGNALANTQNQAKGPPGAQPPPQADPATPPTESPPLNEAPIPTGEAQGANTDAPVKAVEIGLTQANKQTVMRLILTGGMY